MTGATPAYDERNHTQRRLELIARALPTKPGRALDLGAGTGWLSHYLAGVGWEVTAIEASPQAARRCRGPGITVINKRMGHAELLDFIAQGWDLIAGINFLHHTPDPRALLLELLDQTATTILLQIPDRIEHGNKTVAGSHYIALLYDIAHARGPHVIGWTPTNLEPLARRPLLMWDSNLRVGTVTSGNGHTTTEWPKVGAVVAADLAANLRVGSLNLELDKPLLFDRDRDQCIDTDLGPVLAIPATIGLLDGWALRMPNSDRGAWFTEIVSPHPLREALKLSNGDRIPIRLKPAD